jgi:D-amino-acid dehydrogenase
MAVIAVVGGGVIGAASAAWLIGDGHDVTLFERAPDERPASAGNAGLIALPEISPLARPGVVAAVPGWLLDPLGPLALRGRDLPLLTPWLIGFLAAARPQRVALATAALAFLMKTALADHQELARRAALPQAMRKTGAYYLFDREAAFRAARGEWAERARHGVEVEERPAAAVRAALPGLEGPFARALFAPGYWTVSSPAAILAGLRRAVAARGRIEAQRVEALTPLAEGVALRLADGTVRQCGQAVVAAGVWSRELARALGLRVALETERGYNTTWPVPPVRLPAPVFFAEHGFVASPLDDGLRVGGAVELAAVDAPPNFARAAAMRARMRRYFPALPEEGGIEWMGRRPSTPDSLPVIGVHPRQPRIVFAFGHGHLGLTLAAVTARHVAALIAGRPREPQLAAFAIERFQRSG